LCATLSSNRYALHFHRLTESFSYNDAASLQRLKDTTEAFRAKGLDAVSASQQAIQSIGALINREAWIQAYGDCFLIIAAVTGLCMLSFALMSKPQGGQVSGPAH